MKRICFLILVMFATEAVAQEKMEPFGTCAKEKTLPATLEEAMDQLESRMSEEFRRTFKKEDPVLYHFGLGTSIRNCYGLWSGSKLAAWFNRKGIRHPDDMSSIILTSLHRRMNGKPIDLAGQIKGYQAYWESRKKKYEQGQGSENAIYSLVPFDKDKGWVSISGKNIPFADDFFDPIKKHSQAKIEACWNQFPDTPGNSAVDTIVSISIDPQGRVSKAKVKDSAIPRKHADCLARTLLGAKLLKYAGKSYTVVLQSYRKTSK